MARTVAEIRAEIIEAKESQAELAGLTSTSPVALWRLWVYVVAVCIWSLEKIIDISIQDQTVALKNQKRYSLTDYSATAKNFQFGFSLPVGEVEYDNEGYSLEEVEDAKVVKFASTTKVIGGLKIKVAGQSAEDLEQLSEPQFDAFKEYMERVKAAGDYVTYVNEPADHLKLTLTIYRDPLILNSEGKRNDGTNDTPVQDAIEQFVKEMDFDKKFVPTYLVDALQAVEGVVVPNLVSAQTKYALFDYEEVPPAGIYPNSGYLRIYDEEDLTINYEIWAG